MEPGGRSPWPRWGQPARSAAPGGFQHEDVLNHGSLRGSCHRCQPAPCHSVSPSTHGPDPAKHPWVLVGPHRSSILRLQYTQTPPKPGAGSCPIKPRGPLLHPAKAQGSQCARGVNCPPTPSQQRCPTTVPLPAPVPEAGAGQGPPSILCPPLLNPLRNPQGTVPPKTLQDVGVGDPLTSSTHRSPRSCSPPGTPEGGRGALRMLAWLRCRGAW